MYSNQHPLERVNKRVTNADSGSVRKNRLQSQSPNCIHARPVETTAQTRHRFRGFRPAVCSGGGKSSPLSFSTFGGCCFPAGPSFEPGENRELLRFTLPDRVGPRPWAHRSPPTRREDWKAGLMRDLKRAILRPRAMRKWEKHKSHFHRQHRDSRITVGDLLIFLHT